MKLTVILCFLICYCSYWKIISSEFSSNLNPEEKTCLSLRDALFEDAEIAKGIRDEFERFLPVYIKTQFDIKPLKDHEEFNVFGPVGPRCKGPIESFGEGDLEKRACELRHLEKMHNGERRECVIYSIGSNNQWGFEEAIFNQTNCRIETFDCTLKPTVTGPPVALRSRTRLHRVCLGASDYTIKRETDGAQLQFLSWNSINKLTGITTQPTFLKMDIEGYEFPVLQSIINSGKQLPLQIAVEVHTHRMEHGRRRRDWHVPLLELYSFIQYLYRFGGYYLIDRNDNPLCPHCSEILLAKLDCKNHPRNGELFRQLTNPATQTSLFVESMRVSSNATYYV